MLSVDYNKNEPYILIADDDDDDSLFMTAAFKESGLLGSVKRVTDGIDLLVQLKKIDKKEHLPSIIILDLNMPHMNGKDALKAIKKDSHFMHIPVIIYSTSSTKNDMLECYEAGCNGYIIKPNDYHEIERIAEKIKLFFLDVTANNSKSFSGIFSLTT